MAMFSNALISSITSFRNPNGSEYEWTQRNHRRPASCLKVTLAEIGYIVVIPIAIVEAALSLIAHSFTIIADCMMRNAGNNRFSNMTFTWLKNSLFAVGWATMNAILNPVCNDMLQYAANAANCVRNGNVLEAPIALARRDRHIDLTWLI